MRSSNIEWFNIQGHSEECFQWFIGGRGIGKTYSALSLFLQPGKVGIYLRTTETEISIACSEEGNVFKRISHDHCINIEASGYDEKKKLGTYTLDGQLIGYGIALSTFGRVRGIDLSDVDFIVYDEVVPEKHIRRVKDAGIAFANAYESINRNRELEGRPPIRVYFLANSISLDNDVMLAQGICQLIPKMLRRNMREYTDKERLLYINLCPNKVSEAKRDTAIYKLMRDTSFSDQALDNQFSDDSLFLECKVNLREYNPIIKYDNIVCYRHKSKNVLYFSRGGNAPLSYKRDQAQSFKTKFRATYTLAVLRDQAYFAEYDIKLILDRMFNI